MADCKVGPSADKHWEDLWAAVGPDKGYLCDERAGGIGVLLPAVSFEQACQALGTGLKPRGYNRRPDYPGLKECSFIKDASNAYSASPDSPLAHYPVSWTRVVVTPR